MTNQDEDTIANGSATNEPFIYSATDARTVASIQYKSPTVTTWTEYPENVSILTSNGWYYFRAIDGAGNVSDEYRVFYDTNRPLGYVYDASGVKGNGSITNKSYVKYVATDTGSGVGSVYVKKPGSSSFVSYTNGSQLTGEGKYYFKAYDKAGNVTSTTHEIMLDMTAPVGQLKAGGVNVASGSYTSKSFSYTATDSVGVASYQVKKPNSSAWVSYTAGTALTGAEGWYYFRAYDTAGNVSSESKIFYDVSKPTVTLIGSGGVVLTSGTVIGSEYIKATAVDSGSGIASFRVWGDNYSSAVSYVGGTELTKEGRYYFDVTNRAGLVSDTYRIILDKTAPNGLLYANGIKVASGTITNAEKIMYIANDALAGLQSWFVKKPNASEFVAYSPATELTEEGKYEFYSVDYAGNQSAISEITIDKSIPTAQLYVDGATIVNGSYTNGQYIKFVSDGTCYVKKPGEVSYLFYLSGTEFYEAGRYEFYAENEAGTMTEIYTVIIDRTPKKVMLSRVSNGAVGWNDIAVSWTDGDVKTTAPITRITVNGKPYVFGDTIYSLSGITYNIVVYDAAGNEWETKFSGGYIDLPTITIQKVFWEVQHNGSEYAYSFHKYENALSYAMSGEKHFVTLKTWDTETWDQGIPMDTKDSVNAKNGNYYVYKSEEDPEKQVAYFTQERLDEVAKKYAEQTIKSYYYWEKEPEYCLDGDLNAYSEENKIVATAVELREGLIYTLDGVGYTDLTITEPGAHTLLIEDGYGGSVEFEIYILDSAPTIDEVKKYLLNVDDVHTSYFQMAADLKIDLLKATDDCKIYCKHLTTSNDDLKSIESYGLLRLDKVLVADTPLKRFLAEYNIQINPLKKEFSYNGHIWKINAPDEQCQPCLYKKPCGKYPLCDFQEQMGRLHSKLYHDKGEVEFFIGGDEKTISDYQTIQDAPEILIDIARIMKCMHSKISEYCLQTSWKKQGNWKRYLLEFYIPYAALEMNIDIKSRGYYYDYREWFEIAGFSDEDYFDDAIPLTFYHNKHIIENCLSLYFGSPLIKFGQLLPNYHVSLDMLTKIEQIA